jgi:hypothetical protein
MDAPKRGEAEKPGVPAGMFGSPVGRGTYMKHEREGFAWPR